MKRFLTIIFFSLFAAVFVNAQCSIDYTYYPVGANYGLYPDSLPDGYVGHFYDEDMTFFLPLDTIDGGVTVTFTDFHITSISLPLGLTWECNNSANSCHYDPAVTQYGCVNVSGFALMPGIYDVEVNLVATHSLSALVGTENISFILPLEILPDTSTASNAGFAMTNPSGCGDITVGFTNNNTGMLSYYWDFGNGNSSVSSQPVDQIYSQPGQYIVQYSATQTNAAYFLESIEVASGNCSDNFLTGDPDFFYTVSTSAGILEQVSCNNYISQSFPLTINSFNPLALTGQSVAIDLDDDDSAFGSCSSTEDCGSFSFIPMLQAGTFSANGGGLSINYTVMEIPANTVTSTDTINVYGYPIAPNLVYDTLSNIIYTDGDSIAMQWYYYNSPIPGATDTFVEPTASGLYSLLVVNEHGCATTSLEVLVVICDTAYQPTISVNGMTVLMEDSALFSNVQWYDDSGLITGAVDPFLGVLAAGSYYINAIDSFGCSYFSELLDVSIDIQVACNEFIWIDGLTYAASNNIATHVLTNTFGYDSVVILDLIINYSPVATITQNGTVLGVIPAAASYLWSTGEVTQTITPTTLGWHWCVVTDANGCESEQTFYEVLNLSTSINDVLARRVLIYPNPTKELIRIDTEYMIEKITIINVQGSVLDVQLKEQTIDVSNFSEGIYFMEIHTEKGVLRKKFIKN
jgi:PKD repeat protein